MTKQTNIQLGKSIAKHRKSKGLTQEVVAELLDIGNEAVSRIERGLVVPSLKRLEQFAEIFDCSVVDLLLESSQHLDDQAIYLRNLLSEVSEEDRTLIIDQVEKLVARLKD